MHKAESEKQLKKKISEKYSIKNRINYKSNTKRDLEYASMNTTKYLNLNEHTTKTSTIDLISEIWKKLKRRRKLQLCALLVSMIASSLSELISLGALIPFLTILSNPDKIWENNYVKNLATILGTTETNDLVITAIIGLVIAIVITGTIRLINLWLSTKLAAKIGSDLSCEAYKRTIYQSYKTHIQTNSSYYITATTTQIAKTVRALATFLEVIAAILIATGIVTGLIIINSVIALSAGVLLSSAYILLSTLVRKKLRVNSSKIRTSSEEQIKLLQEGFGSIRDILLHNEQNIYVNEYACIDSRLRELEAQNNFLGGFPRYVVEILGFIGIITLGYVLLITEGAKSNLIPTLGVFAMGAQRLLPACQQIYNGWARIKGASESISVVIELTNQPITRESELVRKDIKVTSYKMKNVGFKYNENKKILKNVNIEIKGNDRIGIVGKTGSGKTTFSDLILGLLEPTEGEIYINGRILECNDMTTRKMWQKCVSHVPQNIYLSDKTIAENITRETRKENIDIEKMQLSAKRANIHEFIMEMHDGYNSKVGEKGIQLSGGQKQRIGIARALYRDTKILILDEATSALDSETEKEVMNAIERLGRELIIIIIAHRKNTLKLCNKIFEIKDGVVKTTSI